MVRRLEWWPEHVGGPIWDSAKSVSPEELGLAPDLIERLARWNASYGDNRLPIDGPGDPAWLQEGADLLREVRVALGERVEVVVTEPWWGVPDEDYEQPGPPS